MKIPGFEKKFNYNDLSIIFEELLLFSHRNPEKFEINPVSAEIKFDIDFDIISSGITGFDFSLIEGVLFLEAIELNEKGDEIGSEEIKINLLDHPLIKKENISFEKVSENSEQFIPYDLDVNFKSGKTRISY